MNNFFFIASLRQEQMGSTSSKIVQDDYKQKVNEIEEENVSEVVVYLLYYICDVFMVC